MLPQGSLRSCSPPQGSLRSAVGTMTAAMAKLVQSAGNVDGVKFVSISVDPKNDTPEVLTAYAERFQADRARWLFLTGDEDAVPPAVPVADPGPHCQRPRRPAD